MTAEQNVKVKAVFNDIYNEFYLSIKHIDLDDEGWKIILDKAKNICDKHNRNRLCVDIVQAILDFLDDDSVHKSLEKLKTGVRGEVRH